MRGTISQLVALAVFASAALFLAGTQSMRRIELLDTAVQFSDHAPVHYEPLSDNNGFGTDASFIDKGNLPEGMADPTRNAVLLDQHLQNVAPEGGGVSANGDSQLAKQDAPSAQKGDGYVHLSDNHGFGTNSAFVGMGDGEGTSVKAPTQMLSQEYMQFGQKARNFYVKHGLMSKAADEWAKKMGTGWEKAPVEMLSQVSKKKNTAPCGRGGLCPDGPAFIRKAGLTSKAEMQWAKHFDVENAADKAPTTMLHLKPVFADGAKNLRRSGRSAAAAAPEELAGDVTKFLFTNKGQAGF